MNNNNRTTHQKDVSLKTFWRDNEHFADLFNATVFNGRQVLKPDKLTEMDTDVSATIQSKNYNESITRNRDVVKKMSDGVEFNILGLEIQDKTHYAMPLRTMTYDALGYIKEYNDIKKQHKLNKDSFSSPEEFLSGIDKSDRFHPIITLVLYYGDSLWDGPSCLADMMVSMPDNIKAYFSDYKLNLVQILDSDKYTFYNDDVRDVFNIARSIYNKIQGIRYAKSCTGSAISQSSFTSKDFTSEEKRNPVSKPPDFVIYIKYYFLVFKICIASAIESTT